MLIVLAYWTLISGKASLIIAAVQMFALAGVFFFAYYLKSKTVYIIETVSFNALIILLSIFIIYGTFSTECPSQGCEYLLFANGLVVNYTIYQSLDYFPIGLSIIYIMVDFIGRKPKLKFILRTLCLAAILVLPSKTAVLSCMCYSILSRAAMFSFNKQIRCLVEPLMVLIIVFGCGILGIQGANRTIIFFESLALRPFVEPAQVKFTESEYVRANAVARHLQIKNTYDVDSKSYRLYDEKTKSPHNQYLDFKFRDPIVIILPLLYIFFMVQLMRRSLIYGYVCKSDSAIKVFAGVFTLSVIQMFTSHILTQPFTAGLAYTYFGFASKFLDNRRLSL